MKQGFYQELKKLDRNNEFRSKVLLNGIKRILEDKKASNGLYLFTRLKSSVVPKGW